MPETLCRKHRDRGLVVAENSKNRTAADEKASQNFKLIPPVNILETLDERR